MGSRDAHDAAFLMGCARLLDTASLAPEMVPRFSDDYRMDDSPPFLASVRREAGTVSADLTWARSRARRRRKEQDR